MEQNAMAVREQQWLETIQTAKKSGLPVNQWCHENGIAESTFYRWQQRIRQHLPGSAEPTFVELPEQAKPLTSAQPVHLITVHIQDITVELPSGLPAAQISELIRGIRHAICWTDVVSCPTIWRRTQSGHLPLAARIGCSVTRPGAQRPVR